MRRVSPRKTSLKKDVSTTRETFLRADDQNKCPYLKKSHHLHFQGLKSSPRKVHTNQIRLHTHFVSLYIYAVCCNAGLQWPLRIQTILRVWGGVVLEKAFNILGNIIAYKGRRDNPQELCDKLQHPKGNSSHRCFWIAESLYHLKRLKVFKIKMGKLILWDISQYRHELWSGWESRASPI